MNTYQILLAPGTPWVRVDDIPDLIAKALYPVPPGTHSDQDWLHRASEIRAAQWAAENGHRTLLHEAIRNGELAARNQFTNHVDRAAEGDRLRNARVSVDDLKKYVAAFQIDVIFDASQTSDADAARVDTAGPGHPQVDAQRPKKGGLSSTKMPPRSAPGTFKPQAKSRDVSRGMWPGGSDGMTGSMDNIRLSTTIESTDASDLHHGAERSGRYSAGMDADTEGGQMLDHPEIKRLLTHDLIPIHELAKAIARAKGLRGSRFGLAVLHGEASILGMEGVTFLEPDTHMSHVRGAGLIELAGDWLISPDVAATVLERLYPATQPAKGSDARGERLSQVADPALATADVAPAQKHVASESESAKYMATKEEIMKAFNCRPDLFKDGHKFEWFKQARKPGRPGRGAIAPMFDPWPFAENLPRTTYGKPLTEKQAWNILERDFPDRYADVESFDPRKQ